MSVSGFKNAKDEKKKVESNKKYHEVNLQRWNVEVIYHWMLHRGKFLLHVNVSSLEFNMLWNNAVGLTVQLCGVIWYSFPDVITSILF